MPDHLRQFREMLSTLTYDAEVLAGGDPDLTEEFALAIAAMIVGFRAYRTAVIVAGGGSVKVTDSPLRAIDPDKAS